MNKPALVAQIIARLDAELSRYALAAREAQAGATDEQSRAENKYDTRGLEASYLAHGQSRQALETAQAREQLASMTARAFDPDEPAGVGALVELASAAERAWYLLAPTAGGTEILHEGAEVFVLTPLSPLGQAVLGKRQGEKIEVGAGRTRQIYTLARIC